MKIKGRLYWGLANGEIDTELMSTRSDWNQTIKEEGTVILATFKFPEGVEYDLEFSGNNLRLQKNVDDEPRP